MSAPVSSFRKLSISDSMEAVGAQGRQQLFSKSKSRAAPEDDDSSSETSSSEEDNDSSDDEEENGQHLLALDHCRQIGSLYAFQMVDAQVRRCGIRLEEGMKPPTCSCNGTGECRHTQWLLEQLADVRKNSPTKRPVSPHAYITSKGLGNICKTLKWDLREDFGEEVAESTWVLKKNYAVQAPQEENIDKRIFNIRDILASFTNIPTEDFRNDIFNNISSSSDYSNIYTHNDLEGTLARLLMQDSKLLIPFNTLVPPSILATKYFQNTSLKAQHTLSKLDEYCEHGPTQAGGDYDIIWCAQTLVSIVSAISHNLIARSPLSEAARTEAARTLISMLSNVVKSRNNDVYQGITWSRRRRHGEPQIDRNLYQRLIGSPPVSGGDGMFVISVLQDLPEGRVYVDNLEECLGLLETVGWSAPKMYLEKLRELIARYKAASGADVSPPGSSGASNKRAGAGGMEGKVKRMK